MKMNERINYPKITLAAARVNAGLLQTKAAEELDISRKTLQNYEKGISIPNWDMVHKIETLYGFPADYIIFGCDSTLRGQKAS